jgi:hypothetical protein
LGNSKTHDFALAILEAYVGNINETEHMNNQSEESAQKFLYGCVGFLNIMKYEVLTAVTVSTAAS